MRPVRAITLRPLVIDAAVTVLAAAVNLPGTIAAEVPAIGWICFAAAHLPLLWRQRAAVAVLWTVLTAAAATWILVPADVIFPVIVALIAVYTVVRHRTWRQWAPGLAVLGAAFAAAALLGEIGRADLVTLSSSFGAAVLLGMTIRLHRVHQADALERDRQRARLALAAERSGIAAELHDIISHNLAVMVALADGAGLTAASSPQRAADVLGQIADTGRQALGEMHQLVTMLRDRGDAAGPAYAPQPGLDQLDQLLEHLRATGMRVELQHRGTPVHCGPGLGLTIYRIVQEALTNTLTHAGPAASATVRLAYGDTHVEVRITDDGGRSGVPAPRGLGSGLTGLAERAATYGGRLQAGPLPDGGWSVHTRLAIARGGAP